MSTGDAEHAEFERWRADRAERHRKRGRYWLTEEGRREIRGVWDDADDGNIVLPLLDALEDVERRSGLSALEKP